jgi:hypothetical protein
MNRLTLFVILIVAAATGATLLVVGVAPVVAPHQVEAVAWLSILSLVFSLQHYSLPRGGVGSALFIPCLATALIAPNWLSVASICAVNCVASVAAKRPPIKAIFNIAQQGLATSVAVIVYGLTGGTTLIDVGSTSLLEISHQSILPLSTLVATYMLVNTFAVSGVIAIESHTRVLQVWKQNTLGTVAYDVFAAPIIFLFAWVFVRTGPLGAAGLAVPLFGARQLYKTNRQLEQVNQDLLQLMVKAIEARDPYTSGHSRRVSHYSRIIARAIGLTGKQVDRIAVAALLHDVGKIHEIYAPILRKPGKLTPDEWAIMQTHPVKSAELVGTVANLRDLIGSVRSHHENWDGSGYPDGLAGESIPLGARIIKFADTIDAMTSDRPYRRAMGEEEVRAELEKYRGMQFAPDICDRLLASPSFQLLFVAERRDSDPRIGAIPFGASRRIKATA